MTEKRSDTSVSGKSFVRGKTIDDDERSRGRPQAARVVRRVIQERVNLHGRSIAKIARAAGQTSRLAAGRLAAGNKLINGRHPIRPIPKGPPMKEAARRVTIKVSYVSNRKPGQWAAHGKYLEREGTQEDRSAGTGFDVQSDDVSLHKRLNDWQLADDPRLFKVIISPEDGDRMDLKSFTREYIARLAPHLRETGIEWMGVAHYNTAHPHAHVLLRGNGNLQIPRELLQRGMRNLASEVATEHLGYRSPAEIEKTRRREMEAHRLTPLDRDIEAVARPLPDGRSAVVETPLLPESRGYARQRRRMGRLEALERMGLAEKVSHSAWVLDHGWTKGLRDLQGLRTRTEMVAKSRALMTEPRCVPQVTKIRPEERLVGRVLGTGLDEQYDRSFVLIEGTDYRAHIVYQDNRIEKARAAGALPLRHLVAIEGKAFEKDGRTVRYTRVQDYGLEIADKVKSALPIPPQALDDALDAGQKPDPNANTGFQRHWHHQLLERQREREKEKEKKSRLEQEQQEKERKRVEQERRSAGRSSTRKDGKDKDTGIE